jgi:hypothetical protein
MITAAIIILLGLILSTRRNPKASAAQSPGATVSIANRDSAGVTVSASTRSLPKRSQPSAAPTAEEIVANKVTQFGRNRREIVHAIARRLNQEVPPEVEKFFDAVEAGNWDEIDARWEEARKHFGQFNSSKENGTDLDPYRSAMLDAYGAAEQAHLWPAQELLDYGKTTLDSLRPGMVYVGGTDCGRWIPELLNEPGDAEHIMVTQNGMADSRYQEWISTLYGDRMKTLTPEESQRAFADYTADAARRLQHDQQFPDEPKQVRPGESIKFIDGKVQVSGQVAVMAINERLLQMLMLKNPDLTFATQESFPMQNTYGDASPLGPIMELNAPNAFTAERAAQSLDVWRNRAELYLTGNSTLSAFARSEYSHDATSAGNLLAAHNFPTEAEQVYRLAIQFSPDNPQPTAVLANFLTATGRETEGRQLIADFNQKYPDKMKELEQNRTFGSFTVTADVKTP